MSPCMVHASILEQFRPAVEHLIAARARAYEEVCDGMRLSPDYPQRIAAAFSSLKKARHLRAVIDQGVGSCTRHHRAPSNPDTE